MSIDIKDIIDSLPIFQMNEKLSLWMEDKTLPEDKGIIWVDSEGNGMREECVINRNPLVYMLCLDGDRYYNKMGKQVFMKELNRGYPMKEASTGDEFLEIYSRELEKVKPINEKHYREAFIKRLSEIIEDYDKLFTGREHIENINIKSRYIDFKEWLKSKDQEFTTAISEPDYPIFNSTQSVIAEENTNTILDKLRQIKILHKDKLEACKALLEYLELLDLEGKPTDKRNIAQTLGGAMDAMAKKYFFTKSILITDIQLFKVVFPNAPDKFNRRKSKSGANQTPYEVAYESALEYLRR